MQLPVVASSQEAGWLKSIFDLKDGLLGIMMAQEEVTSSDSSDVGSIDATENIISRAQQGTTQQQSQ
jgi:hypothetical protein